MMIEDLVRQAQQRQADRAVDPERIRRALPARAARRARTRTRTAVLVPVAAVAVAAAVAVPVALMKPSGSAPSIQVGAQPTKPSPVPNKTTFADVPLLYKVTWLPPGVAERERAAPLGSPTDPYAGVRRGWYKSPTDAQGNTDGATIGLSVRKANAPVGQDPQPNEGTATDINGQPGFYHGQYQGDDKSYVEWRVDADHVASVDQHGLNLSKNDLLRVAKSVVADPAAVKVPLRIGTTTGVPLDWANLSGNGPALWVLRVSGQEQVNVTSKADKEKQSGRSLDITLGSVTDAPAGGDPIDVNGKPGRLVSRDVANGTMTMWYLVVDLGAASTSGRYLTVDGIGPTKDDLITIARSVEVTGPTDVSWLGH